MAVSVAELQAKRDALVLARMNGTRRVRDSDGSEIENRADAEIARAIAAADALIAASSPPVTTLRFNTSKGL